MNVTWTVFESECRRVEAQVFAPDSPTNKAILFCSGFPGAGATIFEQRHAAYLVGAGYHLVVLRHNGTRLDTAYAPSMINNAARLAQGGRHLGGCPSNLGDWLMEPMTALRALAGRFDNITVLGNSFGALSSMWSITEPGAPISAIRHLILLAGAQGIDTGVEDSTNIMRIWRPEYLDVPRITDKVTLGSPADTNATLRDAYARLPGRMKALAPSFPLTCLVVVRDELLSSGDTERFLQSIDNKGKIVNDGIDQAHPEAGLMAHDMPDYPADQLLRLITG